MSNEPEPSKWPGAPPPAKGMHFLTKLVGVVFGLVLGLLGLLATVCGAVILFSEINADSVYAVVFGVAVLVAGVVFVIRTVKK